jgi:septal ring factor EnvC (AmiA/AmiB activator)
MEARGSGGGLAAATAFNPTEQEVQMDPYALEMWIQTVERKLQEQERRLQEMEARMKELEERVQALAAEVRRHKQRMAILERILVEKGLLPPELSMYDRWLGTLH